MQKEYTLCWNVFAGIALIVLVWADSMIDFVILSSILGWGTAMVYPTFLATVAENTHRRTGQKVLVFSGYGETWDMQLEQY